MLMFDESYNVARAEDGTVWATDGYCLVAASAEIAKGTRARLGYNERLWHERLWPLDAVTMERSVSARAPLLRSLATGVRVGDIPEDDGWGVGCCAQVTTWQCRHTPSEIRALAPVDDAARRASRGPRLALAVPSHRPGGWSDGGILGGARVHRSLRRGAGSGAWGSGSY